MSLASFEHWTSIAGPAAAAVLLLRLWMEGLIGRYRFFALYLALLVVEVIPTLLVPRGTRYYFYAFVIVESVLWLAQVLVVAEVFSLVVGRYPGIAKLGKNFIRIAMLVAVLISIGISAFQREAALGSSPILQQYMMVAKVIAVSLLAFLLMILGFLFWFPIVLSRNVVLHTMGFSLYFTCRAITRQAITMFGTGQIAVLSSISLAIVLLCLLFWIIFISRKGELQDVTVGHAWAPEQGRALVEQLETINATLLRTARK